jgi:ATP-binding cassette subfamily B multidrug efflux pump
MARGVGPGSKNVGKADRSKVNKKTIKNLFKYIGQYKLQLIFVVVAIIVSAITGALASLFLRTLIDDYIMPLMVVNNPDFSGLLRIVMIMGGIYLIGILGTLFYTRTMVTVSQGVLKKIRDDMFAHMQTLPIGYFDSHSHGDLMSHYTNDTDTLRQMLAQSLPSVFSSFVTIIAVFAAMLSLSIWLTLSVVIFIVLILFVVKKIAGQSGKYFGKQQKSLGDVNGFVEEMIHGLKVIKVFNHEEVTISEFDEKNSELAENSTAANKYANILMPIMQSFGYFLYVLLAIVGGVLVIYNVPNLSLTGVDLITLGMIASFLQLSRSFIQPIAQVSQQLNAVIMAFAGAERIFNLMDEKSETDDGEVTLVNAKFEGGKIVEADERTEIWAWKTPCDDGSFTLTEVKGEVRFFDAYFGYNENQLVLHDINLYAEPGQKVAFVGATGAGKTTITNLINRFYDLDDGKIRYDGININRIMKNDLRRSLGIVLQDVNLFTDTVMENIRYGRLDASDKECIEAARLANADGFIRMLPKGYETVLSGDGSGLSQGQRQLVSIARAAVADPPVMILDEATSSIDTRTEAIIQEGMDALMKDRTVFVIAHRLSTVKNADVIMVLEQGKIIERGSHKELVAQGEQYYQLYTGAFELD